MHNAATRNAAMRREVRILLERGYPRRQAIAIVAEKYFLSPETVRDIIYDKRRK